MKKYIILFNLALGMGALSGCSGEDVVEVRDIPAPELTVAEEAIALDFTGFGVDFLAAASQYAGDVNMAVSPFSAHQMLSMIANVADETTKAQICEVLGTSDAQACNSLAAKYLSWLPAADSKVKLSIANSVWYKNQYTLNKNFGKVAEESYGATLFARDFTSAKLCDEVNGWYSKKTTGMIPEFYKSINPEWNAILLNALYFNGEWAEPFDAKQTQKADFKGIHGTTPVDMMATSIVTKYSATEHSQAVWLHYGLLKFSMVCMLPDEGVAINKFLLSDDIKELFSKNWLANVDLKLPKFSIIPNGNLPLNDIFTAMGVGNLSSLQSVSLFENAQDDRFTIAQRACVTVDEKGTVAAAVTGTIADSAPSSPKEHAEITFDRPFIFFIRENATGMILFAGKVVDL